jgi:hypothetical protein
LSNENSSTNSLILHRKHHKIKDSRIKLNKPKKIGNQVINFKKKQFFHKSKQSFLLIYAWKPPISTHNNILTIIISNGKTKIYFNNEEIDNNEFKKVVKDKIITKVKIIEKDLNLIIKNYLIIIINKIFFPYQLLIEQKFQKRCNDEDEKIFLKPNDEKIENFDTFFEP